MEPPYAAESEPRVEGARRIVVVDDDPTLVEALVDVLTEEGWAVDGYTDPEVALERLMTGPPPALILLDYVMPRLDGEQFINSLSAHRRDFCVVVLSAIAERPPMASNPCVVGVIHKPFDLDRFLRTLDDLVASCAHRPLGRV